MTGPEAKKRKEV